MDTVLSGERHHYQPWSHTASVHMRSPEAAGAGAMGYPARRRRLNCTQPPARSPSTPSQAAVSRKEEMRPGRNP